VERGRKMGMKNGGRAGTGHPAGGGFKFFKFLLRR
jgi:hypothetical protein